MLNFDAKQNEKYIYTSVNTVLVYMHRHVDRGSEMDIKGSKRNIQRSLGRKRSAKKKK